MDIKAIIEQVIKDAHWTAGYTVFASGAEVIVLNKKGKHAGKRAGKFANGEFTAEPGNSLLRNQVKAALAQAAKEVA